MPFAHLLFLAGYGQVALPNFDVHWCNRLGRYEGCRRHAPPPFLVIPLSFVTDALHELP
jgi:hypothetical protein